MSLPDAASIRCPYCGEYSQIQLDVAGDNESYVEDCTVCCRPIAIQVERDEDGTLSVSTRRDSE